MSIKPNNVRLTITISKEDYQKIEEYAKTLNIYPTRLITKIIQAYCHLELEKK